MVSQGAVRWLLSEAGPLEDVFRKCSFPLMRHPLKQEGAIGIGPVNVTCEL